MAGLHGPVSFTSRARITLASNTIEATTKNMRAFAIAASFLFGPTPTTKAKPPCFGNREQAKSARYRYQPPSPHASTGEFIAYLGQFAAILLTQWFIQERSIARAKNFGHEYGGNVRPWDVWCISCAVAPLPVMERAPPTE